ncbi:MAG: leucine-rich repeat protein [Oscillospiraceae bacterium]|nr:leucine-rich repeat protein [Oscillospiraceae bacterium]
MKQRHFCMRLTACILTAALLHPAAVFSAETESGDFEIRGGVLIRYHGDDEIVHVPEGVTEIGELAFSPYRSCKPAEKTVVKDDTGRVYLWEKYELGDWVEENFNYHVCLPSTVKKIDRFAFCSTACSVELPEGLEVIEEGAFMSSGIERITFPDTLTRIGTEAFAFCTMPDFVLPDSVTELGEGVFCRTYLQSVALSSSLTEIPDDAFADADMTAIMIPDSVTVLGTRAFQNARVRSLTLPEGLEVIGDRAFAGWMNEPFSIPDTVKKIGANAFADSYIQEIVLPDSVTEIGSGAFRSRTLESAVLSASLTEIPDKAFANTHLQQITVPASVTRIGSGAFQGTELHNVTLSEGLQEIADSAFEDTPLESISLPPTVTKIGDRAFAESKLTYIEMPDSVEQIGKDVFQNTKLESFSVPAAMKEIPDNLLKNCPVMYVKIPDGVTAIGAKAFAGTRLKSVVLPDSVQTIGEAAFQNCTLESVQLPQHLTLIPPYAFSNSSLRSVQIPDEVTEIGEHAFSNSKLTSAVIPDSVRTIGKYAFARSELQELTFAWKDCVVPGSAFQDTPFRSRLGQDGFEIFNDILIGYHGSSVNVTLPEGIRMINEGAFQDAGRLLTVRLPDSLRVIGDRAFRGCRLLRAVQWNSGLQEIGEEAFANCGQLRKAELPDSVRSVGASAFENCAELTDLRLNDGLEHLGSNAVDKCRALKTLRIPESLLEAETIFQEQPESLVLYGGKGTAAEQIAAQEGVPLKPLSALPLFDPPRQVGQDLTLNPGKDTWRFANTGENFGDKRYLEPDARDLLEQVVIGDMQGFDEPFDGSCYGMSVAVVLAKQGLLRPSDLQAGAKTLGELKPTEAVQSVINFYQYLYRAQSPGSDSQSAHAEEQFADMVEQAANVQYGESPFVVTAALSDGSHAMVGYGLESGSWEWNGRTYDHRILLWDPNAPDALLDDRCLYFDDETYDYCIPSYGLVHVYGGDRRGRIISASSDPARLAPAAYPFLRSGDLNCDGSADVTDAVMLARFLAEDRNVRITDRGLRNAELDGVSGITSDDLSYLLNRIARII